MRFLICALGALLLSACASAPDTAGLASSPISTIQKSPSKNLPAALSSTGAPINVDNQSVAALKQPDDIWSRIRKGFQLQDMDGDLVQSNLDWYTSRPDYVQRMTDRSKLYLYHIVNELEQRNMPTELALLPFIESAYNPQALSVAKAAGMWQFVPGTGKTFNLRNNMFQDERRDVLASTSAALDYLQKLHDMFGDWYLALAAYNWGEGNVQRAIARNQAAGLPTDYMSLKMPAETRNYVPKLQAVKNIIENPQAYGLSLPDIPNHPYFVTVTTAHDIDVDVAAKLAGMSSDEFKALNPSFRLPMIVGATQAQILLPFDNAQQFQDNLKVYSGQLASWTTYTVDSRTTPEALAQKIGVDVDTLRDTNRIPRGMRLKPGSTVVVPRDDDDEDISADVAENAVLAIEPDVPDTRKVLIRVRRHETMASVASRYGVTVAQLRAWNKRRGVQLSPGQTLVLHVPVGKPLPVAAAAGDDGKADKPADKGASRAPGKGVDKQADASERNADSDSHSGARGSMIRASTHGSHAPQDAKDATKRVAANDSKAGRQATARSVAGGKDASRATSKTAQSKAPGKAVQTSKAQDGGASRKRATTEAAEKRSSKNSG
ncbi:transglycosylase SLT domain-containing protein [Pararobbsia silviterrae]|uniref:LysM peptidoglycan-binding domain-containing protein n=1 Tax=Pararobbsia silviterrae TaxID=1792498 RepID=A0A494Y729_9BURK|nr:transglycosylase SLT domain-containing protein [Pararobbsia silviterrae]RKP56421.1 LysM peptidoglycan-binding domain-containing protein [Pararobbsia silviterrae]